MQELTLTITMLIPGDLAENLRANGPADYGAVKAKPDEQHVADFANSLKITREHFKQEGEQQLFGLYEKGTDTVMAHTGTSPRAPDRARILAGLWNALHAALIESDLSGRR